MVKKFGFSIVLICLIQSAYAWNGYGHMVVAAVAYDQLTTESKARVTALLKMNPEYSSWVADASPEYKDQIAFMRAATWPDYIKHAAGYSNDGEKPKGAKATQNIGYSDKLMHRYWHYEDLPFSPDGTPLIEPVKPNAETQIKAFRKVLADKHASAELKSYDLVWLLHLVGDVHQPLHATSRFTKDDPNGDRGGNDVALCAKPCRNELHAAWDSILGNSNNPIKAMLYAKKLGEPNAAKAAISGEDKWIKESLEVAETQVYIDPIGAGIGPYTLTKEYRTHARSIAKARVALAGARLANLINEELK